MPSPPKPKPEDYELLADDLTSCKLCEWQCGVNRLEGEVGVCGITLPEVSSSQLHPAPPASFDAFLTGCSFRCLSCQNWPVANYPANDYYDIIEGYYHPKAWAELAVASLNSPAARSMGADRLFFTGGEPTCSLPWVEEVVRAAREIEPGTNVNFDTNGYMSDDSLTRILRFSDSITFDIKAYDEKLFSALTGAEVGPVLRNAERIARSSPEKLWEFRILVIPRINENDIADICSFIADIDNNLPVNFLAFRPNFVLEDHSWTSLELMEHCVETGRRAGLENVSWSGRTKEQGTNLKKDELTDNVQLVMNYAKANGCIVSKTRLCGQCKNMNKCSIKKFITNRFN
jgi:pyruvate formate lyase activating enzyme